MSPLLALRVISLRRKDFVAIGGIADIENCRWKVSHRWHDCALKKTSSPQSGWGSWQPKTNGTSIDSAINAHRREISRQSYVRARAHKGKRPRPAHPLASSDVINRQLRCSQRYRLCKRPATECKSALNCFLELQRYETTPRTPRQECHSSKIIGCRDCMTLHKVFKSGRAWSRIVSKISE